MYKDSSKDIDNKENDETSIVDLEEDASSKKTLSFALNSALAGIKLGNNSRWSKTFGGAAHPKSAIVPSSASSRARSKAGATIKRGEGALRFLFELSREADAVDQKFNPLFDVFKNHDSAPSDSLVGELLSGWESVYDFKSTHGEKSAYNFIVGRRNSILRKFEESWIDINRFVNVSFFEKIHNLFSPTMGSFDINEIDIEGLLNSILKWRAVVFAIKKISSRGSTYEEAKSSYSKMPGDDNSYVLDINLSSVRSGTNNASVDRFTKNIMIDRGRAINGEPVIFIFYFTGEDTEKILKMEDQELLSLIKDNIEYLYDDYPIGSIVESKYDKNEAKIYVELNLDLIRYVMSKSKDVVEIFKIKDGDGYLKVEGSDLNFYNEIKKIAYSTTTSYYTVTTPSGKKVDLSIADMVMGKGYVSSPGNKFKAKSLSKSKSNKKRKKSKKKSKKK